MSSRRFGRAYLVVLAMLALPGAFVFLPGGSRPAAADAAAIVRYALAQAATGQPLYQQTCATCHGERGEGTSQAPPIVGLGPAFYDFMMSTGRMPLDQPTQEAIRRPPVLSRREIHAITAYLVSLAPGTGVAIPAANPSSGDLSVGQSTYELNCAPCHGTTGNGGAVGT